MQVEKEEKPSSQNETLNSSVNGDLDKLNVEKDEITPYEKKYYALFQRCEIIKQVCIVNVYIFLLHFFTKFVF